MKVAEVGTLIYLTKQICLKNYMNIDTTKMILELVVDNWRPPPILWNGWEDISPRLRTLDETFLCCTHEGSNRVELLDWYISRASLYAFSGGRSETFSVSVSPRMRVCWGYLQ